MDTHKCGSCDELLTEGAHCTSCKRELHFHCGGVTEAGYRKLGDKKLTWRCSKCKNPPSGQLPSSPRTDLETRLLAEIRAIGVKLTPLEHLKNEVVALRTEFASLKTSLDETNKGLSKFNAKIKRFEERLVQVEKVQSHVDTIQTRLDKIEQNFNLNEQWTRMYNVEIKGIPQVNGENLYDILSKVASKIQYPITKTQVNFLTRVPTREKEHTKPIIISFCNRYVKEDFVAAARYASKTGPLTAGRFELPGGNVKIYVNDHLTLQNKALLSKAKKAAAEKNFRYVWIKHAKIHVRKTDASHVVLINTEQDLAKIV